MGIAAIVATVLLGVLVVFQIALALGAPWGTAAWGGLYEGVLSKGLRINSAAAAVVLAVMALYVLTAGDVAEIEWLPGAGVPLMWVLTGFFVLSALANFTSRSKIERIWGPVALALAVCCAVIAVGI
jgi:hypothetical protein